MVRQWSCRNKPVLLLCAGIAAFGLLILVFSAYYSLAYGRGNLEAGNFHRCRYWTEWDEATGKHVKRWETNWALTDSTEGSTLAHVDTWVVGIVLVVLGVAIWVGDYHYRPKGHF